MTAHDFAPSIWVVALSWPLALSILWTRASWRATVDRVAWCAAVPALVAALWPAATPTAIDGLLLGARGGLDDTGRAFLFVTGAVWTAAGLFARGTLADDPRLSRFHLFWVMALAGNVALVLAQDMVAFYAGFALMSFASFGLVVHLADTQAFRAGRVYIALVIVGEVLVFAGMLGLVSAGSSMAFPVHTTDALDPWFLVCIFVGFGIKAGALPLHLSLPLIYPASPPPAAVALGGAMINAGLLGWLRFLPFGAPDVAVFAGPVMALGLGAAFFGAIVGVVQGSARTVLAYSSISQMGVITVGVGAALLGPAVVPGAVAAVTLYALHHGLSKGALFVVAGACEARVVPSTRRWFVLAGLLPALALAGAPLTSGAVAKVVLKDSLVPMGEPWADALGWMLPLAAVGTTLLMARFLALVAGNAAPEAASAPDGRLASMPLLALLLLVATATWAWPGSSALVPESFPPGTLLTLTWPVVLGTMVAVAGRFVWRGRGAPDALRIPPGDWLLGIEWAVRVGRQLVSTLSLRLAWLLEWFIGQAGRLGPVAERAGRHAGVIETHLRAWPSVGLLLVAITGCLLFVLSR